MNNFFEHKILVKYADGCLEKRKDWNWFSNEIIRAFDLDDNKISLKVETHSDGNFNIIATKDEI